MYSLLFYLTAGFTAICSIGVASSRSVVYSAFFLMGALFGAAGLYAFLAADFVAAIQVLVYVGGILVLTLFAIVLTHQIDDVQISNRSVGRLPALGLVALLGGGMVAAVARAPWKVVAPGPGTPTTQAIGVAFLDTYLLPFELASVVLLTALIGAILLSRKELRE